jgi:hypothetical protein
VTILTQWGHTDDTRKDLQESEVYRKIRKCRVLQKEDYSLAQQRNCQSAASMSYVAGGRTWRYGTGLLVTSKSGGVILEGCGWMVEIGWSQWWTKLIGRTSIGTSVWTDIVMAKLVGIDCLAL